MTISPTRLTIYILTMLALSACASSPTAVTDHDHSFDFSGIQTIVILPVSRQVIPTATLSDMQASRIAESMANELRLRGYTVVEEPAEADLWMTWHLVTQERTQVQTYNTVSAHYSRCWHCTAANNTSVRVRQYTQGTIIVDMIDPKRKLSVWRSILDKPRGEQREESLAQGREERAKALFSEFPP